MLIITSQMIRDIVHFHNGPMPISALYKALKAVTPEDKAEVRTIVKIAAQSKVFNYNPVECVIWVEASQFKSCN